MWIAPQELPGDDSGYLKPPTELTVEEKLLD
jgi:hypothetical protein